MSFSVRHAVPQDASAIAQIHVSSWQTTYAGLIPQAYLDALQVEPRVDWWRRWTQDPEQQVLVAEDEERGVFGFASAGACREDHGYDAELYTLYLLREAQGQGAGRALLRAVSRALLEKGYGGLTLWVLQDNPSRGFYEHLGGAPVAQKEINIGGATLQEVALGWRDLKKLA